MRPMPSIILIACAYAAAIFTTEMTLGNPDFPLHLWHFTAVPAWQWSVPVHAAGFLWIAFWSRVLRDRPAILSFGVSWTFFVSAETINRTMLGFFDYSSEPFGSNVSFTTVLILYAILCVAVMYAIRRYGPGK